MGVTFDIDANGISNVSASDKSSGKSQKITITNDNRTSKDKIDEMVADAEKFAADDKKQKEKIEAKNGLESLAYTIKDTADKEELKDKLSDEDKEALRSKASEVISWLDDNYDASIEQFEEKKKELEAVSNPIMTKMYQQAGGAPGGMPGGAGMPTGGASENANAGSSGGPT